ncbi:EAL domain-containing response regulator [Thiocapsa marina]|uniref:Response regulator receiver modulated diguanylate cyclase/phosphodiesterase n=1 Tax=Thiocapsa marina 5811 TaxID=768671 RepID=F9UCU5_9GAMM|nr:EAL domain-containing protein [Thiocapsa marina]EGV18208.1 response regulator receiver modulated diguanylate cyclase/phosphodiesterase [Thiocapsa marina 5811]
MTESDIATPEKRIFYLGNDSTLQAGLASLIGQAGLQLDAFKDLDALEAAFGRTPCGVLILDLRDVASGTSPSGLIARFTRAAAQPATGTATARPEVVCVADAENIETRLEVMRAGARGYFPTPIALPDLAKRLVELVGPVKGSQPRILVVEDDPLQAKYIALLLSKAGMEPHIVDRPLEILRKMHEVQPDLVLMDLYMPDASGTELTAIIRDHGDYFDTPIIFLSAETDPDKQLEALRVGGDSFIAKPIQREQLIGAIEHRIRMSRLLKGRRVSEERGDVPAGGLSKDEFLRGLDRVVHDPEAHSPGAGLLLIELDRFQDISTALGVEGMERLLRQLEEKFLAQLAAQECAARLDDFTFAVLARRASREALEGLGEQLLRTFGATKLRAGDKRLSLTVTIGIGLFTPPADDAITMVSRSRTTVARARHAGGNRVRVWTPVVAPDRGSDYERLLKQLVDTAVNQDGLLLMFQPIVSLGASVGELYEVQLRLRTLDGEHVPAADFLPVAERGGLMPRIDRWVLEHALDVMDAQRKSHPKLRLLIHQTVASVAAAEWLPWFREQMVRRNLIRRRPLLQFQLSDIRDHLDTAKPLVDVLRKYGIQVCVANVTGNAADLELLADLPVALAKLSFATLINADPAELLQVVQQIRTHGASVIAAGIEDPATIARVWNCRPDYIQGNSVQMPSSELSYDFHHSTDEI